MDNTLYDLNEFISLVHKERVKRNLSASKLSSLLGFSSSYMGKVENGVIKPSLDKYYQICNYLEISQKEGADYKTKGLTLREELLLEFDKRSPDIQKLIVELVKNINNKPS